MILGTPETRRTELTMNLSVEIENMSHLEQNETRANGTHAAEPQTATNAHQARSDQQRRPAAAPASNWAWKEGNGHFDWMDSHTPFTDIDQTDLCL
jgi:hypothetical protein